MSLSPEADLIKNIHPVIFQNVSLFSLFLQPKKKKFNNFIINDFQLVHTRRQHMVCTSKAVSLFLFT